MTIEEILAGARVDNNNNGAKRDTNECGPNAGSRKASGMTDVTIRGIEDDVYSNFAAEAKKRGIPIGELTTKVMKDFVEGSSGKAVYHICDLAQLTVSKNDLESTDGTVSLSDIEMLEFADDVDWETFRTRVDKIQDVELIVIPKSLSKFQVLTKARDVQMIRNKK
ncbi:MAG: hypothetical protein ABR879_05155 [Methanomassiliicoccales archaeon]